MFWKVPSRESVLQLPNAAETTEGGKETLATGRLDPMSARCFLAGLGLLYRSESFERVASLFSQSLTLQVWCVVPGSHHGSGERMFLPSSYLFPFILYLVPQRTGLGVLASCLHPRPSLRHALKNRCELGR